MSSDTGLISTRLSPSRGASPSKVHASADASSSKLSDQICNKVLWVYVILAVVMLGVVYWLYQQHKADTGFPVGEDSDAPTWFTPLVFSLLLVISVVAVAYGTFRAYTASQKDSQRNAINVAFGAQVALTMLWAYCFLSEQNQTHALYVAVALLAVTAWQAYYTYSITPMAAYVQAPLLISGAIFAYVNYKVANAA